MYASSFFREVYSVEFVQIVGAWSVSLSSTHLGYRAQWCASEKELCLFLRDGVQRLRDSEYELSRYFEVQHSPDFENEPWQVLQIFRFFQHGRGLFDFVASRSLRM